MEDSKALQMILDKLDRLDQKVDKLQSDVSEIREDVAVNRGATNTLLEWAEKAQVQVQIPLFKK
jgi:archaellum component FlaC